MGQRGPVGKPAGQKHGHRTRAEQAHDTISATIDGDTLDWPEPGEHWHDYARDWYLALARSGQARDYTPSDVATAVVLAENLSRNLHYTGSMSGNALSAFLNGCTDLLATAGARRRVKLELDHDGGTDVADAHRAAVTSLTERRRSS